MRTFERVQWALVAACWSCAPSDQRNPEFEELAEIIPLQSCADSAACDPCTDGLCDVHFWPFIEPFNADRKVLAPTSSHVCVLSGVRGNLFDVGTTFGVHRRSDSFGERWYLGPNSTPRPPEAHFPTGPCPDDDPFCNDGPQFPPISLRTQALSSSQFSANGSGAYATCVPLSNFQTDLGGEIWTSETFKASARNSELSSVEMWWGDAASFIMGLGSDDFSHFDDEGDGLFVIQGGPSTPTLLSARSYAENAFDYDFMGGEAISLFVGVPHSDDAPRFYSFGGQTDIDAHAGAEQRTSIDLDRIDSSLCYLTILEGDFRGGGEWVAVLPYEGLDGIWRWRLDVRAGSGEGLYAAARCVQYDQCKHPENGCVHPVDPP